MRQATFFKITVNFNSINFKLSLQKGVLFRIGQRREHTAVTDDLRILNLSICQPSISEIRIGKSPNNILSFPDIILQTHEEKKH